jgi:hypothetical protein
MSTTYRENMGVVFVNGVGHLLSSRDLLVRPDTRLVRLLRALGVDNKFGDRPSTPLTNLRRLSST